MRNRTQSVFIHGQTVKASRQTLFLLVPLALPLMISKSVYLVLICTDH